MEDEIDIIGELGIETYRKDGRFIYLIDKQPNEALLIIYRIKKLCGKILKKIKEVFIRWS